MFEDLIPASSKSSAISFDDLIPSTSGDIAKSAGTGLVKGALNVAGMVPDVAGLLRTGFNSAINAGARAVGVNADPYNVAGKPREAFGMNLDQLGTSAQIKRGVESVAGPFYRPQTTAGEYAQTMGEFIPSAMAFPGGPVRNALVGAYSGAGSETGGQMTKGTAAEPYARAAGALAGGMVPGALSRVVTPLPINPARAKAVEVLRGEGVPLTAGQVTGSRPLQYMESTLGDIPFSGGRAAAIQEAQREAFTGAGLKRVGETAKAGTPDVMQGARQRIGSQFDDIAARAGNIPMDAQFAQGIGQSVQNYVQNSVKGTRPALPDNIANSLVDFAQNQGGMITGQQLQSLRSKIGEALKTAKGPEAVFYRDIRNLLDDMVERTAAPGIAQEWGKTRAQYGNMKTMEQALGGAGEGAAQGFVSPQALRAALAGNNRSGYVRGQGDLAEIARAGNVAMPQLPNSGTAQRSNMQNMLSVGSGLVAGGATGDPYMALLGLAGPSAVGRALMSRPVQGYLGNQAIPRIQSSLPAFATPANPLVQQLLMARIPAAEGVQGGR